jgi:TatD DNase family protein
MLTDAHCHPFDLAEVFPAAEEERKQLGVMCASSASSLAEFEYCEKLASQAAEENAAPLLPCFAVHPQMPMHIQMSNEQVTSNEDDFPHSPLPPERCTRTGERVDEQMQNGVGQLKAVVKEESEGPPTPHSLVLLEMLASGGHLAAIGETGFDLYNAAFGETEKIQDELFAGHVDAALRYNLPIVIHARRAMHKIFACTATLKKCRAVIFHSWPGTAGEGEALLRRGVNAFFSFGTTIMLNHREAMRCCAVFPSERILTETDAPFQPPMGREFSRYADLKDIIKTAAALRRDAGTEVSDVEELEKIVEKNFRIAFEIVKTVE